MEIFFSPLENPTQRSESLKIRALFYLKECCMFFLLQHLFKASFEWSNCAYLPIPPRCWGWGNVYCKDTEQPTIYRLENART